ncbi:DENN domain-containing protein 2D-like isoform X1 [Carcharodon carcharias]|uniref:DENN domain-containing protein 2D-like isoform X1 n=2 Tax=Carcharodon carcharias TaxID=13397 RepID=UPI001B7F180A|nr:DENN domain-containing protein 2D-like isoform X1 [Carcharodon carcharias]
MATERQARAGGMSEFTSSFRRSFRRLTWHGGLGRPRAGGTLGAKGRGTEKGIERSISVEEKTPEQDVSRYSAQFFEYLVVVSLKKSSATYEPQITYQFPKRENLMRSQKEEEESLLKAIPLFCFPDGNTWAPLTEYESETFSFVLTNMDGSRKFGYCRRLLPRGGEARLPEVFCIISCLGCFGLFSKILDEVEKRRQISFAVIYPFMQGLREAAFPAPGKTVCVKSFIPESGTEIIKLTRPSDSRLEHVDFSSLLKYLSEENVIHIFASLLLERRVIFLAEELSILSQCIHGIAALLYPFTWQHTYIPVLPKVMLDIVCSPTPFVVGVQRQFLEQLQELPIEECLMVDLHPGTFLKKVGDENDILPHKLYKELLNSLQSQRNSCQSSQELNKMVTNTFVLFFIKIVGHYPAHLKRNGNETTFQDKQFRKSVTSKSIRRFLKTFMVTQMFSLFVQELQGRPCSQEGFFEQKIREHQESRNKVK